MKFLPLTIVPAMMFFTACHSDAPYWRQAAMSPSMAGGAIRVESERIKAVVQSIDATKRVVVLQSEDGGTNQYRIAPGVANLDSFAPGNEIKARVVEEQALYLNNTPPPAAGPGDSDFKTKIFNLDKSYRLLTLDYPNDEHKDFKVPLGTDLKDVNPGDDVIVRSTTPIVVAMEPR